MYAVSIPVFLHGLRAFAGVLKKGQADAEARKFSPDVLLQARLAPDMLNLTRQVQVACDMVKNGAGRLAGIDLPSFPDTETTFDELQARIAKTIAFLDGITESQLQGSETREITLKFPGREMTFTGIAYLTGFVLPNFYFHMTTAFGILRHNGVQIGKMDYIGA